MTKIDLTFRPQREALLSGHSNRLNVLLQAQAPDAPESVTARKPLNLSLVIDRSGSMQGRPLDDGVVVPPPSLDQNLGLVRPSWVRAWTKS